MDDARWKRMWELFHEAAELPAERRAAWLDDRSADDATLRNEVEELLAEHEEPTTTFERTPSPAADPIEPGERVHAVSKHAAAARLFSFGIGRSVNRYLLDGVARAGRATPPRTTDRRLLCGLPEPPGDTP